MNLNKVFILGRLTQNPEKRSLPSGQPVVSFGVATNRFFTSKEGEKQQEVEFHNVTLFGKLAETVSQYLNKGSLVLIEGRLRTRNWQDSSGKKHYRTEIIGERVQFGPKFTSSGGQRDFKEKTKAKDTIAEEEIPVIEEESSGPKNSTPSENPASPETPKENPGNRPENNPVENKNEGEDIDVSRIPF